MNAATYTDEYSVEFYSYYAHCISWCPKVRMLFVYPIVADNVNYAISPTTTRQVNRFLRECVSPRLSVAAIQYGFDASDGRGHYDEIDDIDVRYVKHSHTLKKSL